MRPPTSADGEGVRTREASQRTHGLNAGGTELPPTEMGGRGDAGLVTGRTHAAAGRSRARPAPPLLPIPLARPFCQMPNLMVVPLLGDEEVQREEAEEDSDGGEGGGS